MVLRNRKHENLEWAIASQRTLPSGNWVILILVCQVMFKKTELQVYHPTLCIDEPIFLVEIVKICLQVKQVRLVFARPEFTEVLPDASSA